MSGAYHEDFSPAYGASAARAALRSDAARVSLAEEWAFRLFPHAPVATDGFELPARTRELAILTLAAHTESAFVWAQHEPISEAAGLTETTRKLIRDHDHTDPALFEPDQAVLRFTASVVTGPHVSDELFTALRGVLSEREIVELLHVIGY